MPVRPKVPAAPFTTARRVPAFLVALTMVVPALMLAVPLAAADAYDPLHPNTLFYMGAWSMDRDGNGLDDALDQDLADGATGQVYVHVHYGRRPTAEDAALLERDYGAVQTYVFRNWDMMQVESTYERVAGMRDAPGVVAVEKFEPPTIDLDTSTQSIRARQAAGVPVVDGIDHAQAVHETLGYRGEGMVIAILDTGVDNLHESLDDLDDDPATDDPKLLSRIDPVTGQRVWAGAIVQTGFAVTECVDPADDGGHGTHVAGIALGTGGPSGTYAGVAPQAHLVDIDIAPAAVGLGMALGFDWIISFNKGETCYGDPGADRIDVCNLSYGMAGGDNPESSTQKLFTDVVRSGVTCTVSAGNSGSGMSTLTKGPEGPIMVADVNNVNTVVRSDDRVSSSSSRGPRVSSDGDADPLDQLMPHVGAPGTSILAPAFGTLNQQIGFSGTSMAAPHVAGVAALMLQANPGLAPVDKGSTAAMGDAGAVPVRDVLLKTAQFKTLTEGPPPQASATGRFGLPWNNAWGYGMVDAYAAVQFGLDPGQLFVGAGLPRSVDLGQPATLRAEASGGAPPYSFAWDLGDGTTLAGQTVTHTYADFGTYTATVTVTDAASATRSASTQVHVVDPRIPGVVARAWSFDGPDGACDAQDWISRSGRFVSVSLSKPYTSAGGSLWHLVDHQPASAACAWYNGVDLERSYLDNTVAQLDSPAGEGCLYMPPGAKAARLTFKLAGETETGYDQMQVMYQLGPCIPDTPDHLFSSAATFVAVDQYEGVVGNLGAGVYETKVVNLDGIIAAGGGHYQLRFRFYSDPLVNREGYQIDDIRLHVDDAPPVLDPIGDRTLFTTEDVAFTVSASDPDADPVTLSARDLPEGATFDAATGAFAWSPGDEQDGVHAVTFAATDGLFTTEQAVTLTVLNVPPVAAGSADREETDRLTAVQFTDASTDPDGQVVAWLWDFGDGTTSTEQHPTHTYSRLGSFQVTLTVTDDDGATASADVAKVKVKNLKPQAAFGGIPGEANRVDPVQFRDASNDPDGRIASWSWSFGDGAVSGEASPAHQYAGLGAFPVTLTVTDDDGDSATATGTVTVVNLAPRPDFTPDGTPTAVLPTEYLDQSVDRDGDVVAWSWDFGNRFTSEEQNPTTVYLEGGVYDVTLRVRDNEGAETVLVRQVLVCQPGADLDALLDPSHVRLEVEACVSVDGIAYPGWPL